MGATIFEVKPKQLEKHIQSNVQIEQQQTLVNNSKINKKIN